MTWAVAELRSEYDDEVLEANEVYMDAMEVLTDPEASQSKINSAKTALAKRTLTSSLKTGRSNRGCEAGGQCG